MLLSPVFHGATSGGFVVLALPTPMTVLNQRSKIYGFWCEGSKSKQEHKVVVKGTSRVETLFKTFATCFWANI